MPIKFGENTSIITESDLKLRSDTSKIVFNNSNGASEYAEIDAVVDGTNGGQLRFLTKVDNGNVTEKLRINNAGAIGIGGNYGTDDQVLTSQGTNTVIWRAVTPPTPIFGSFDILGNDFDLTNNAFTTITDLKEQTGVVANGMSVNSTTGVITLNTTGTYLLNVSFTIGESNSGGGLDYADLTVCLTSNAIIKTVARWYDNASDFWSDITLSGQVVIVADTAPYQIIFRARGSLNGSSTVVRSGTDSSGVSILKIV